MGTEPRPLRGHLEPLEERPLPHNIEAEMNTLGSLEIDKEALSLVSEFLRPDDFYIEAHRTVYEAMLSMVDAGIPVDAVLLTDELQRQGLLEDVGGAAFVSSLSRNVVTSANVEHYAHIVERTAILRRLITAAGEIASFAYSAADALEAIRDAEKRINAVSQSYRRPGGLRAVGTGLHAYVDYLTETVDALANGESVAAFAVPTALTDLDRLLGGGLRPADLAILAARPAVGKTSLALSIAQGTAAAGYGVAFFSLEMHEESLLQRLLSMESGVDLEHLRRAQLSADELIEVLDAAGRLESLPLYVDDAADTGLESLRAKIGRLWMERSVDLVIVDYLQLMHGARSAQSNDQRRALLGELTRGLKLLAKELGIPILVLSQLSREVEKRADKKPLLSDLAESGTIETDADIVFFVHRDEVYNPETDRRHIADVIVAKHRNGPVGQVSLFFQEKQTRYRSLEIHDHAE